MLLANKKMNLLATSLLPLILVAIAVAGVLISRTAPAPAPPAPAAAPGAPPVSPAIEQRYGVRINMVGVTADGGLLDLRFTVLDSDKAMAMHQDLTIQPYIIDEQTGVKIDSSPTMSHKHQLNVGLTYFELYRNPKGVVQPGRLVTVVVGDERLEHLVAQ
jgi:hypothetical protein